MSTTLRLGRARALGVPLLALGALIVISGGAMAGPPEPTVSVEGTCANDDLGDNWSPRVDLDIDVSYKGRWVEFKWFASIGSADSRWRHERRWDSGEAYQASATFLVSEPAKEAHAEVVVLKRGEPVGDPFVVEPAIPCTTK